MMLLKLLELWTVSAGILIALWYILLSNTTGGVYITVFSLVYLLLSWYLELGNSKKNADRHERSIGLWCALMLPLIHMLSYRQEDYFQPLTVSVVFVHYTWTKPGTSVLPESISVVLLLLQAVISLLSGPTVLLMCSTLVFALLYGAIQKHLSQSFTVGEGAIVSQLLTYFGFKVIEGATQQLQGIHTDILDKATAVIYVSVALATVLFVCLKSDRQKGHSFYLTFGLVGALFVLPAVVFMIRWDGIKTISRLMFNNKKSIFLFLWWIVCSVISVYIVIFYGNTISPSSSAKTFQKEQFREPPELSSVTTHHTDSSLNSSLLLSTNGTVANKAVDKTVKLNKMEKEKEKNSCRSRRPGINCDKDYLEIQQETEYSDNKISSESQLDHQKLVQSHSEKRFLFVTTRVRKLFHMVMIAVYIPGLLCNTSMLYLASVVALAVLVILEVIRLYKVPPLGPVLDQYFTVFLDRQDSGDLILTPLYLLIGCSLPLWLSHTNNGHADLKIYAGIVSTGIGDSAASLVGQKIGKHRWPDSKKTVEGTMGAIISQLIAILILQILGVPGSSLSGVTVMSVILISCLEAFSGHIDNLVVSLFAFMLFSTTGTFM